MLEPRVHQRAVGFLVVGQFTDNLHLGAGVREHINEVVNDDIQLVRHQVGHLLVEFFARLQVQHLIIRILDVLAEALQLLAEKLAFILVLGAFVLLVDPPFRVTTTDLERHQSGEERIAGILRSSRQNAVIDVVGLHAEIGLNQRLDGLPLVVAKVVDDDEEQRLVAVVEAGNHLVAHHGMRHDRLLRLALDPVHIIAFDITRELRVGLLLLISENAFDAFIGRLLQFQLPAYQLFI